MSFWTEEQIKFLQSHMNLSSSERYHEYVRRFGSSRTSRAVERQLLRVKSAQAIINETISNDDEEEETETSIPTDREVILRSALGQPDKSFKTKRLNDRKDLDQFVNDLIDRCKDLDVVFHRGPNNGSSLCIVLSDTHIGKLTDNFNAEIFKERILSIPEKIQKELALPDDLEEIVLLLVGDMLEGESIYETQAHHLELSAIDQVQIATRTFWELGLMLRNTFNVSVRFEDVPGNHGRVSKMADEKTNWDNAIYQTLGLLAEVSREPNIKINVNFEAFNLVQIQDKICMMYHHGTKHLGSPAMQTKVAGWIHTKNFDFAVHGHWHHWEVNNQFGKVVMKNGSLPGDDDLAERMGVFDPPRQGWLLVRKNQPVNQMGYFEWDNQESI